MAVSPLLDTKFQKIEKQNSGKIPSSSIPAAFSYLILKQRAESHKDNPANQGMQKSFKFPSFCPDTKELKNTSGFKIRKPRGFPGSSNGEASAYNARDPGSVGKIPWRRK